MNYKQLYDNVVNSIREKNHLPEPGLTTRHSIIPPSVGGSIARGFIHVTPKELFILRKLLTKVYRGNGSVYQAFKLLCDDNHAKNSREYVETCTIAFADQEIATIDDMINEARHGSWGENTARRIQNLIGKKQEIQAGLKILETRYLERVSRTVDFEEVDEEARHNAALMKILQEQLNPKQSPIGTVKRF
jgi:hypothetical protein